MHEPSYRRLDWLIALLLFGFCLALYVSTLTPGLPYALDELNPVGDSHEFTMAAVNLRLTRRTGYPIYTWLGFLFIKILPFGQVAYRMNLMSAVFAAAAVATIYFVARHLELRPAIAALAALALGVSTTFWSQAVIAEVYTLNLFVLGIVLWLLLRWSERKTPGAFAWFALAFGISIGTHMSNLSLGLVFALFVLATDWKILTNRRALVLGVTAFLIGLVQFVWVPLQAATAPYPNPVPDSWWGFYKYTLGAFSNLRFAYPLHRLPHRALLYGSLLVENFTYLGVAIGLLGIVELLRQQPKRCLLFLGIFLVNVVIAMQVFATDVEVFFLPSYVAWAIFVGWGARAICHVLRKIAVRSRIPLGRFPDAAVAGFVVLLLACWLVLVGRASFAANDRSTDTTFADFYENAFAMLPPHSILVPWPGVFGAGVQYLHRVMGLRPDVEVPDAMPHRPYRGGPVYTTLKIVRHEARPRFMARAFPKNTWFVPVLFGGHKSLVLYRADPRPPTLLVSRAEVPNRVDRRIGEMTLVGFEFHVAHDVPRARLHLKTYWQLDAVQPTFVLTRVDDRALELHELGLGNLQRYLETVQSLDDNLVAEVYDLVLPSSLGPGTHELQIGLTKLRKGNGMTWVDLGSFQID